PPGAMHPRPAAARSAIPADAVVRGLPPSIARRSACRFPGRNSREVAFGAADVIFVEFLVGLVQAAGADLDGELVILAHDAREIIGGVDYVELRVDIDFAYLRDRDDGGIAITRDIAGRQLYRQVIV